MTTKFIIGLSGTHGTGKSSILNGVADAGFIVDRSQLSRSAQANLGWDSLSRAQESVSNMWLLQDSILKAMRIRDRAITESGVLTLVERTPADLWGYTRMWCERLNINWRMDSRANSYHRDLVRQASEYSSVLLVQPTPAVPFVAEPNRADAESRALVDNSITSFLISEHLPVYIIQNVGKAERIAEVVNYMTYARSTIAKENP